MEINNSRSIDTGQLKGVHHLLRSLDAFALHWSLATHAAGSDFRFNRNISTNFGLSFAGGATCFLWRINMWGNKRNERNQSDQASPKCKCHNCARSKLLQEAHAFSQHQMIYCAENGRSPYYSLHTLTALHSAWLVFTCYARIQSLFGAD